MVTGARRRTKIKEKDGPPAVARARWVKISTTLEKLVVSSQNKVHNSNQEQKQQVEAGTLVAVHAWRRRWSSRRHCRHESANADNKSRESSTSTVACWPSEHAATRPRAAHGAAAAAAAHDERRRKLHSSRISSIESPTLPASGSATTATAAHATQQQQEQQQQAGQQATRTADLTDDKIILFAPGRIRPCHAPFAAQPEKERRKCSNERGWTAGNTKKKCRHRRSKLSYIQLTSASKGAHKFLLPLFTLFLVTIFTLMNCYCQVTWDSSQVSGGGGGGNRGWPAPAAVRISQIAQQQQRHRHRWPHRRSLFGPESSEPAGGAPGQAVDIVPYQTYYVTQACEWKSNLFVPKSNDILFAQPQRIPSPASQRVQQSQLPEDTPGPEDASSRTIFTTSNKALILALPPISHTTFAGYEPACSIRLIVPRNMRILAKLTARRLTFEQELLPGGGGAQLDAAPLGFGASGSSEPIARGQLWLNVSQNQFSETEQKTIETEGNVLAFRFLLERFASLREPDIRLQVVLTAFQTLGENSDTGLAGLGQPTQSGDQLICDSGRLISANLACDGFRNCLDGQDEEPASCAALRQQQHLATPPPPPHLSSFNQTKPSTSSEGAGAKWWSLWRIVTWITRDASPFVALLLGILLLLLLLFCCTCCCYCLMLLVRKATIQQDDGDVSQRRLRRRLAALKLLSADSGGQTPSGAGKDEDLETDSLARGQNLENAARLKARGLLKGGGGGDGKASASTSQQQQRQQPLVAGQLRQLQSILKRPLMTSGRNGSGGQPTQVNYKGVAPLARFESIPALGEPPPPPPRASANRKSTADTQPQQQQQPSPRRGALADSLTSARSSGRSFPDFRPTPATRGKREPAAGILRSQPQAQRHSPVTPRVPAYPSTSGTPRPPLGAQQVGVTATQPVAPMRTDRAEDEQQQQQRQQQPQRTTTEASNFAFKSRTTQLEQTSTSTGNERVTVYQYSSNLAQYSESYLLRQQQQRAPTSDSQLPAGGLLVTGTRVAPSTSSQANDNLKEEQAPELPPKSRQSSLI